jgi:hypothetical protein
MFFSVTILQRDNWRNYSAKLHWEGYLSKKIGFTSSITIPPVMHIHTSVAQGDEQWIRWRSHFERDTVTPHEKNNKIGWD